MYPWGASAPASTHVPPCALHCSRLSVTNIPESTTRNATMASTTSAMAAMITVFTPIACARVFIGGFRECVL